MNKFVKLIYMHTHCACTNMNNAETPSHIGSPICNAMRHVKVLNKKGKIEDKHQIEDEHQIFLASPV
jgi:hypothetical protein